MVSFFTELSHETTDGSEIQNKLYDLNHIMSQDWHNNPDQVGRRMFPSQCKWHFLWLFVYLLYHHYFLCTITDWLSFYFFFYNKPHCWKENVSQGQSFSGRTQKKETFQKPIKEIEFASKIVLTYCETKIVLVIEKIFFKLFTLSLAYLKSFSWFLKQFFKQWWKASKPAQFLKQNTTF